jgi:hypothetical protein
MINTTQFLTTNGIIKPLSTTQSRYETLHRENQYTPRSQYEIPSQNPTWTSTASFISCPSTIIHHNVKINPTTNTSTSGSRPATIHFPATLHGSHTRHVGRLRMDHLQSRTDGA